MKKKLNEKEIAAEKSMREELEADTYFDRATRCYMVTNKRTGIIGCFPEKRPGAAIKKMDTHNDLISSVVGGVVTKKPDIF